MATASDTCWWSRRYARLTLLVAPCAVLSVIGLLVFLLCFLLAITRTLSRPLVAYIMSFTKGTYGTVRIPVYLVVCVLSARPVACDALAC